MTPVVFALLISTLGLSAAMAQQDVVNGNLIMMNDNGGWCWYQDERTLFDQTTGQVLFASVADGSGIGGSDANQDIEVTSFDINTGDRSVYLLKDNYHDDHAEPALWQRPDGRYLAAYCKHNDSSGSSKFRISTSPNDMSSWQSEYLFNWSTASGESASATYNNLLYLSAEGTGMGRLYNITRHFDRSPIVSYSDDWGQSWSYAGPVSLPDGSHGYSNGYIKFASNGVDRIDFIITEAHPRDYNNSIYHGYIQGGQTFNSTGSVIDSNLFDSTAPTPESYTPVFLSSPEDGTNDDSEYHRAWTAELERDEAGNLHGFFTTRYGTEIADFTDGSTRLPGEADHRLFYARLDAATSQWTVTELGKMGGPLYSTEQDYTGLGAIDPKDPSTIYISTPFDPRDDSPTDHHEIYKGVTSDQGTTWQWTAVTENSLADNLKPIIPSGDGHSTSVLWLRGTYTKMYDYHLTVVGLVDRPNEKVELTHYVDADQTNTTYADGSALITTGPSSGQGAVDDLWHERTGYGNEGSIFASNEKGDEDAPTLKTTLWSVADGTYDVFAYFWADIDEQWLIEAGFSEDDMVICEKQGSQQALVEEFDETVLTSQGTDWALYRAYVGRTEVDSGSISVFIDDLEYAVTNGHQRVWYDGLGYAEVITAVPGDANFDNVVDEKDAEILALHWGDAGTAAWADGDFNGDRKVNALDASILAANWGTGTSEANTVPEPSSLIFLLYISGVLMFMRRRA